VLSVLARLKRRLARTPLDRWVKHRRALRELARWTAHDQQMLEFYRQFLAPGDLCFDVGANIGNRVKIFLKLGARIVAVEPQLECARTLRAAFGRNPHFTLVEKALGASEGQAEMLMSEATAVSSLSADWVAAVSKSGRFEGLHWTRKRTVAVTSLDRLIEDHGAPAFVKIDVEGFEYEVVRGLSRPVRALSLEFTPEFIESTFRCFAHLERIGSIELNYSLAESMRLERQEWGDRASIEKTLAALGRDLGTWGDVYVRFV
jgi:FkbM family methyltransferase